MAATITLVDGGSYIDVQYSSTHKIAIPKKDLKVKIKTDNVLSRGIVMLIWDSSWGNKSQRPWIELDYTEILSPTVASAAALRTLILNWIDTESPPAELGGGSDGSYIGKPSGGDFVTTYISGTTINLGYRPAFLTGGTAAESVAATWAAVTDGSFRATIDGTGYNVDAIDFTGNTTMALVAATIQAALRVVTSALETVTWDTDHFIISSVLFEATSGVSVLTSSTGVVGTDISGVVGTWMDANAGSGVATVVRGGYPPGITGFIDEDIEYVRQIATDGSVTAVYERVDSIMAIAGHTLTVAEATFLSTDTFVVGTNVARGSVDDIIRLTSSSYIGKPANGDFITAYTSANTITCSIFPPEIAGINHEDIEIVKQFDAAGNVIKTFTKDDTLISEAANVITVTDGAFAATDTFVIYTNIPRDIDDDSLKVIPGCYIGKAANADFVAVYTGADSITLSAFPPGVVAFVDEDIEWVRQISTAGAVTATYDRDDVIMSFAGSVLTVTGAAFVNTDSFVVQTNVPRGSEDDKIRPIGNSYIGKPTNGDFVTAYAAATTIDLTLLPPGLLTIEQEDIEAIKVINTSNEVIETYTREDTAMSVTTNTITVANAAFAASDTFIVYTNIPRDVADDPLKVVSGCYIGKSVGGHFVTAYLAPTTITLSAYPPGITAFTGEDIEFVRQISTAGAVVNTYDRDDATMAIAANVLTITGAAFGGSDTFVIGTNVPIGSADDIIRTIGGGSYVGKPSNGDFTTAYLAGTTITLGGLPPDIVDVIDEDIEVVKQVNTSNAVVATYTRDDTIMSVTANVLTVTDATFAATDTFIVYTNIPNISVNALDSITNAYIGKPSNGDFVTAYASGTTIDFTILPPNISAIVDEDIEAVKQIDTGGVVVQVYTRDDAAMSVTTNTLTVTGATFAASDTFVVYTNIPRDIEDDAAKVVSGCYIGKSAGGDFTTAYLAAATITLSVYPPGITAFTDEDIEFVRQVSTAGVVTATYDRDDVAMSIAANVLTVTGAAFVASDTFVIGTNVPRGSVNDIIRAVSGCCIGKPTNGDFTTAYLAGTTITLAALPSGVVNIEDEDIEIVKQVNTSDVVVATYTRDDTIMSVAANVLTVTDATFGATDTFIVYTNIPRVTEVTDISADIAPSYIGKNAGTNADFTVTYTAATQITLSAFTPDITQIYESDIEVIRHCTAAGALVEEWTHANSTINDDGSSVITVTEAAFGATDLFVVFTNIPRPSGGGGGIAANYKIPAYGGTATYASSTTITLAGDYPAINDSSQVIYIKYTDTTLNEAEIFRNGQGGVLIEHSAGTLTLVNAGVPFSATNTYEVGLSSVPIGDDVGLDVKKTSVQNPNFGHYTDVELIIDEADLGIDGTFDGGGAQDTVFTDTGETFTEATIAEGYTIYNVTQATSAIITADTLSGQAGDGGAGTPTADDITHAALGANWVNTNVASIPEVKRFVFSAESFPKGSIDVFLDSQDANNACYCKIYATNDDTADATSDIWWKNVSDSIFGNINGLSADGIGAAVRVVTQGIYPLDTDTVILKWMLKIVAVNDDGTQDNIFKIRIKKGY